MACTTYQGLLHSLRVLDAHIDRGVRYQFPIVINYPIQLCNSHRNVCSKTSCQLTSTAASMASRRSNSNKRPTATAIRCVHSDPVTGFQEYFVVPHGKKRGCWHSEASVDLSALVEYRFELRRNSLEKERLARERKKQEIKKQQDIKSKAAPKQIIKKRKAPSSSTNPSPPVKKPHVVNPPAKTPNVQTPISLKQKEFEANVKKHRDDTLRLLKISAAKGEASVCPLKMTDVRSRSIAAMRAANHHVALVGGRKLSDVELTGYVQKAEQEALTLYVQEMQRQKARKLEQLKNGQAS